MLRHEKNKEQKEIKKYMLAKLKKKYYQKSKPQKKRLKNLKLFFFRFFRLNYKSTGEFRYKRFYTLKTANYIRKTTKKFFDLRLKRQILYAYTYKHLRRLKIDIRLTPRNMFCTLIDLKKKKTCHIASSGTYKVKISHRYRKKTAILVLNIFFKKIIKHCKHFRNTTFNITTSKKIRRKVFSFLKWKIRKIKKFYIRQFKKRKRRIQIKRRAITNSIINIISKKSYNGCRAKKRARRKRRKSRRLKVL
jgi:hypothetical protein